MADIFDLFKKITSGGEKSTVGISYIVAGLGNPGEKYSRTRHNAGFLAIDYIAQKRELGKFRLRFKAMCAEGKIGAKGVLFMKPETYMNNSGEAIAEAASFYKIQPENIAVIVDDIYLAPGTLRIRENGSAGGHRGLESIISHISSENFPRFRIGVGEKPSKDYDLAAWVLGVFPKEDQEALMKCFEKVNDALPLVLDTRISDAMSKYNGKA